MLTSWSFSFQTREQLQADLLRCQAKIEDLEKLLVEKGQVSRNGHVFCGCLHFCSLGGVPGALVPRGLFCGSASFTAETREKNTSRDQARISQLMRLFTEFLKIRHVMRS